MWTFVLALGLMLLFTCLTVLQKALYDRIESPLWLLEDKLSRSFEKWTGGSRKSLRHLVIALAVLSTAAALGLTGQWDGLESVIGAAFGSFVVLGVMLLISWRVDPVPTVGHRIATYALILTYLYQAVSSAMDLDWYQVVFTLSVATIRWTDYIVWADRKKPRKEQEHATLPERFLKRIQDAGLVPQPAGGKA